MWETLETFLKNHQHIIAALEAVSTFAAVIISLSLAFLSLRSTKTHLNASIDTMSIYHSTVDSENRPSYLVVEVTNTGTMPLWIPWGFFHWRVPFAREAAFVSPLDHTRTDKWIPQKEYPIEIPPRGSESFYLSDVSTFEKESQKLFPTRNVLKAFLNRYITARVCTVDGMVFKARVGKSVKDILEKTRLSIDDKK